MSVKLIFRSHRSQMSFSSLPQELVEHIVEILQMGRHSLSENEKLRLTSVGVIQRSQLLSRHFVESHADCSPLPEKLSTVSHSLYTSGIGVIRSTSIGIALSCYSLP